MAGSFQPFYGFLVLLLMPFTACRGFRLKSNFGILQIEQDLPCIFNACFNVHGHFSPNFIYVNNKQQDQN
jgi:hypothetical protein